MFIFEIKYQKFIHEIEIIINSHSIWEKNFLEEICLKP